MAFPQTCSPNHRILILSYDQGLKEFEGIDFREVIIDFLLENGVVNLKSYIASTIYFEVPNKKGMEDHWLLKLTDKYGDEFYCTIAMVAQEKGTYENYIAFNGKTNIETEFDDLVRKIKRAKT